MNFLYKISNTINDKVYIGYTCNIKRRWSEHRSKINWRLYPNSYLYRSMIKHGVNNFSIEVIDKFDTVEEAKLAEIHYIAVFKKYCPENLLNLTEGGDGATGYKHSDESRAKISKALKGTKSIKRSIAAKGRIISDYQKKQISIANTGKKHTQEHINKRVLKIKGKKILK